MDDKSLLSIIYHNVFEYPLTASELTKWQTGGKFPISSFRFPVEQKNGYYFLKGREELIAKRLSREKIAKRKMVIAANAARVLGLIPSIRLVGVTGALAMKNTAEESDIDLILITSASTLWITRLIAYILLGLSGIKVRRFGKTNEKDKLCLNMWLDESSLIWPAKQRSIYSAHELGQIVLLVNKNNIFEYLMWKNKWIKDYWPNVAKVISTQRISEAWPNKNLVVHRDSKLVGFFNRLAFRIQKQHMQGKITREIVTEHKAIFHPVNRTRKVFLALQKRGGT